jgi:hypothetical protein
LRRGGGTQDLIGLAASHEPIRHDEFYHLTARLWRDKVY